MGWCGGVLERARHDSGLQSWVTRLWASHFSLWDSAFSSVEWGKWYLLFLLHRKGGEQLLWRLFSMWGPVLDVLPYRSHHTLSTIPRSWNHSYFHKSDGCSKSWSSVSRLTAAKKQSHSQNSSLTAVYAFYSCLRWMPGLITGKCCANVRYHYYFMKMHVNHR